VAGEAGYTRGALYHLFANKEDLALAVVNWVEESWNGEVRPLVIAEADPVDALIALARGHVVYRRVEGARRGRARRIARIMLAEAQCGYASASDFRARGPDCSRAAGAASPATAMSPSSRMSPLRMPNCSPRNPMRGGPTRNAQ